MISIAGLNCHAGVPEIAGRHPGDRTAGIAERCGLRHDLCRQDRVMRFVSAHVSLKRGVVMGTGDVFCRVCFHVGSAHGWGWVCGSGGGAGCWLGCGDGGWRRGMISIVIPTKNNGDRVIQRVKRKRSLSGVEAVLL